MSRAKGALPALARWRAFEEARVADRFQRESFAAHQADARAEETRCKLEDVSQSVAALLVTTSIDLPRLQLASQIRNSAADLHQADVEVSDAARMLRDSAQAAYAAARAQTRVVEARGQRRTAAESDRREKLMFDWTADLHSRGRSVRND
ncbi:MAG: hypothetical protein M3Q42_00390 [Pseudomonadota bacterium]|nr:hypothetical protein [Pseudomonadota bacterium]